MMRLLRLAKRAGCARGSIAIEAAIALPLLITLILGGVEVSRYILLNQKLERTAATIADLTAQVDRISDAQMDSLFAAVEYVMTPFDLTLNGHAVVSLVVGGASGATIAWQRYLPPDASGSELGVVGNAPSLPKGFVVGNGEHVLFAETYFDYTAMLAQDILPDTTLYRLAVFRPRFGTLTIEDD